MRNRKRTQAYLKAKQRREKWREQGSQHVWTAEMVEENRRRGYEMWKQISKTAVAVLSLLLLALPAQAALSADVRPHVAIGNEPTGPLCQFVLRDPQRFEAFARDGFWSSRDCLETRTPLGVTNREQPFQNAVADAEGQAILVATNELRYTLFHGAILDDSSESSSAKSRAKAAWAFASASPAKSFWDAAKPAPPEPARPAPKTYAPAQATLYVTCPANAVIYFDGIPTRYPGTLRVFQTPPITVVSKYTIKAEFMHAGRLVAWEKEVEFAPGGEVRVTVPVPAAQEAPLPPGIDERLPMPKVLRRNGQAAPTTYSAVPSGAACVGGG